ncbi:hypothetical protein Tco_1165831 [Tanacetum coccineum]
MSLIPNKSSIRFTINKKKVSLDVDIFREIIQFCPKIPGQKFEDLPLEYDILSFIRYLGHSGDIIYLSDVNGIFYKKNIDYVYLLWEDFLFKIENKEAKKTNKMSYLRFTKIIIDYFMSKDKYEDTQVYGTILLNELTNQAMLESKAYKTYYAFAYGEKTPKLMYVLKKAESDTSPKRKPVQATKGTKIKTKAKVAKSDKKKQPTKFPKAKGLDVLSKVALTKVEQLKMATKRSKKQFYSSHASGSGDGVDTQSKVPHEQHLKKTGADEGIGTIPGVPDVPIYESESEKESWGDSEEEDEEDENDSEDKSNGNDDDANDDDNQEGDDTNDDDEETDSDRTESDRIKIHVLNYATTKYYEEEEEKIDDEEMMDEEEDHEVTKELYDDVNVNLGNEDTDMTNADQGASEQQNVSQESGFEQVEEDAHVTLTLVLDTQKVDEPVKSSSVSSDFTSKLLNLENPSPTDNEIASLLDTTARHATAVLEITSSFTTTIPPPPLFFNPLLQQATPTPTPKTSETTTSFPSLLDFSFVFRFNNRVTNLVKDLSKIKQVDQYAQALSSITAIVDRYIDNKLREAINKAIQAHNLDCIQEAQDEKNAYVELVDTSMRALINEEVNTQLPQILPQVVSDFANHVIEKNVIESVEDAVLTRSSSQPKSTYDALFESYNTKKDLFDLYGEVFSLKRSRDDRYKDQDPSAGSDRGTKRRKSNKDANSSRDLSHTVDDSGVQQDQEFDTGNNDEQPANKEVTKDDWFKKPERPPTPDSNWNKRQHVDSRPPQTRISQVARAKEPHTSFDELMDTSCNFSAFVLNRLYIKDLTQEILVGPTFELLKGTCKSKPYPFDLSKPLLLIRDHRGRQVIPQDFFITNDLEYLKGRDLSRWHSTSVTKTKATTYKIKWIEDLVRNLWSPVKVIYDQHSYWGPKHQHFYGFAANMTSSKDVYFKKRIIAVTRLLIMKKYDYGHLEEIEVRREDQKLYKFREGDFPRLCLQDIKDMLLILVQHKLTNLTIDEWYDLNVALRMFTRRIVIQRRVEYLKLGVKSYQKKLNVTKPDTFRSNIRNRTTYTAYSDPKGVIYKDQMNRNRLTRANELHKFSDGTLNDVQSALNDIAKGIRMEYLTNRR